jgi:cytochrome c-type biogenesis protein CcmH/NrfG
VPRFASPGRFTWVALIAIATFIAYSGSFDGEFVSDDIRRVRDSTVIRSLHWTHLKEIFTTFDGANYMPLKVLSLAVDYQLWGPSPTGFHVTNLLIHIGCALVIFDFLMRLGMGSTPAGLTALVWAVHPLNVESVAWISERKNVLSGLFFFAAFAVYLRFSESRHARTYLAVLGLYVLALLSKMNTMVLPAICLAYEATYRFRLRGRDIAASLPFFAIAAFVAWYNISGNPIHGDAWHGGSRIVTWLSTSVVVFRYLGNLIAPVRLLPWYEVTLRDALLDPPVLLSMIGLVGIAATTLWLIAVRRREAFWILWFWIALGPMLNVAVPFRALMHDRYMYLAMVGPLALAAIYLTRIAARSRAHATAVVVGVGFFAVALVGLTLRQVEVWASPLAMWGSAALHRASQPGDLVRVPDEYDAKVAFLTDALERDPDSAVLHNNIAALHQSAGKLVEALAGFEAAAELDPNDGVILLNLGRLYLRTGQLATAQSLLQRAASLTPYSAMARLNLARAYLMIGNVEGARTEIDAVVRLRPSSPWVFQRERAYLERLEAAQRHGGG